LPPRRTLRTPAGAIEYVLSGLGEPAIVLFNGSGVTLEGWMRLYPQIESIGTVLAWNRHGAGASSAPVQPQTGAAVVATARELLAHVGLKPPYLLVGHSLGGLYANLYARLHPHDVGAVVLIEATHPRDREMLKGHEGQLATVLGKLLSLPQRMFRANLHAEIDWVDATAREVACAGPFPDVPLTVVSGGSDPPRWLMPPAAVQIRRAHQRELSQLSTQGQQVIAPRSGHFPQLRQPELVLDVLRRMARAMTGEVIAV
jgi:pimeloyl-ACP methyl ester carboxylesterase